MKAFYPRVIVAAIGFCSLCAIAQPAADQAKGKPPYSTRASCPITKPTDSVFVPPAPYPTEAPRGGFFFGTSKLGVLLWQNWGDATNAGNKTVWWSEGYNGRADPQPKLIITGRRLDTQHAPVVLAD